MFTVTDNNGNVVFKGIGGDANAWAKKNVRSYGDLYVHYYGKDDVILHWFIGTTHNMWGISKGICNEWIQKAA